MELQQLRTFLTVAREGTLVRAARCLALSQPALSAQLKALEQELHVLLFDRGAHGMSLTDDGRRLVEDAERAVAAADAVVESARRMRGEPEGRLRLASLPDPMTLRLGEILARVAERFPRIAIELRHASSREVRRGLLEGSCDAGFILGPSERSLARLDLRPVRLVVAVPQRESTQGLAWRDVCALPWIGSPEGCPFQLLGDQLFERMGGAPASRCQADLEDAIIEMIDAGLGASLLREESALEACKQDKCTIVPGVSIATTLAMVWPRNSMVASALEAVRGVVAEFWGSAFPLPAESSRLIGG